MYVKQPKSCLHCKLLDETDCPYFEKLYDEGIEYVTDCKMKKAIDRMLEMRDAKTTPCKRRAEQPYEPGTYRLLGVRLDG